MPAHDTPETTRAPIPQFYSRVYGRLYALGYHKGEEYSHAKNLCARLSDGFGDRFDSALDIGCSVGWAVRHFKDLGLRAAGVDVAPKVVNKGVANGLDLHVASATALPFGDDAFDLVMSTDCFEHLRPEDVEQSIDEACRVARTTLAFKINPRLDRNKLWKLLAGTPLHQTTKPIAWWIERFEARGCAVLDHDHAQEEFILSAPGA